MSYEGDYDPKEITIIVGGIPITGYASDTFINITNEADDWGDYRRADGGTTPVRMNDDRATITITLAMNSPSNTDLDGLRKKDLSTKRGAPFDILVRNLLNGQEYYAEYAWVMKPPDAEFGNQVTTRPWAIRVSDLARIDAGRTP